MGNRVSANNHLRFKSPLLPSFFFACTTHGCSRQSQAELDKFMGISALNADLNGDDVQGPWGETARKRGGQKGQENETG